MTIDNKNTTFSRFPLRPEFGIDLTWEINELLQLSLAISHPTKDLNLAIFLLSTINPPLEVAPDDQYSQFVTPPN